MHFVIDYRELNDYIDIFITNADACMEKLIMTR